MATYGKGAFQLCTFLPKFRIVLLQKTFMQRQWVQVKLNTLTCLWIIHVTYHALHVLFTYLNKVEHDKLHLKQYSLTVMTKYLTIAAVAGYRYFTQSY